MTGGVNADDIVRWLMGEARTQELSTIMEGLGHRLMAAGVPVDRFTITFGLLNPSLLAAGLVFRPHEPIEISRYPYADRNMGLYERSPFKVAHDENRRVVLDLAQTPDDAFGIVPELKAAGLRHYAVTPLTDSAGGMMNLTVATARAAPFEEAHHALIDAVLPALTLILEIKTLRSTFRNVLGAYVGAKPANQIVGGTVHLGQVTQMRAAILLADLRGFTHLSTRMPPEATAEVINRYYDIVVPAVTRNGGEVLKFIGDAVLAVFPAEEAGDEQAALAALDAARAALDTPVEPFTIVGSPVTIRFGIGVHLGDAVFGNVGSGDRLDFTVIGRDVNIAARIAALCSRLGRDYLVSDAVAAVGKLHGRQMAEAGSHPVRGLENPLRVHVPDVSEAGPIVDDGVSQGLVLAPD